MICLGLSPLERDATVALLVDGHTVCVVAEERLSRQRQHAGFPYQAVEMALRMGGISPRDVDRVAYAAFDAQTERKLMRLESSRDWQLNRSGAAGLSKSIQVAQRRLAAESTIHAGPSFATAIAHEPWWRRKLSEIATADGWVGNFVNQQQLAQQIDRSYLSNRQYDVALITGLCEFGLADKLERLDHQRSHAAGAFYGSGWERALVVTLDSQGSGCSATINIGDAHGLHRIGALPLPYSIGALLNSAAAALNLPPHSACTSIEDLAAYGDPEVLGDVLRSLVDWNHSTPRWRRSSDAFLARRLAAAFRPADIAAAYQSLVEELVTSFLTFHLAQTGLSDVVLAGEVIANSSLARRILETPGVKRIHIHPNMGDGGASIGAAMLLAHDRGDTIAPLRSAYLGPAYSNRELHAALSKLEVPFAWRADIEGDIARLLADNHVVARFHDRLEDGPEALGNRSILAPASNPKMKAWLQERLRRPAYAPLGCAVLAEDAQQLFEPLPGGEVAAQFKSLSFRCTSLMHDSSPAAVHVDGTTRAQWVTAEHQPSFHRVLDQYKQLTGLSCVVSTNLSRAAEPLACSPHDAIRVFLGSGLDYLALGEFLVTAPQRAQRPLFDGQHVAST